MPICKECNLLNICIDEKAGFIGEYCGRNGCRLQRGETYLMCRECGEQKAYQDPSNHVYTRHCGKNGCTMVPGSAAAPVATPSSTPSSSSCTSTACTPSSSTTPQNIFNIQNVNVNYQKKEEEKTVAPCAYQIRNAVETRTYTPYGTIVQPNPDIEKLVKLRFFYSQGLFPAAMYCPQMQSSPYSPVGFAYNTSPGRPIVDRSVFPLSLQ